jgi:hypothetical protein
VLVNKVKKFRVVEVVVVDVIAHTFRLSVVSTNDNLIQQLFSKFLR